MQAHACNTHAVQKPSWSQCLVLFPDAPIFFSIGHNVSLYSIAYFYNGDTKKKQKTTKAVALAILLLLVLEPNKFTGHHHPKGHPILHRLCYHECIFVVFSGLLV